jgi:hypothetical protein
MSEQDASPAPAPLSLVMKEYDVIRSEITDSTQRRFSILQYGLAAAGGVLAFGVKLIKDLGNPTPSAADSCSHDPCFLHVIPQHNILAWFVTAILSPALLWAVLILWVGEYQRIQRAGLYVREIEQKVNNFYQEQKVNMDILGWETWLVSKHLKVPYWGMWAFFSLGAIVIYALGTYYTAALDAKFSWLLWLGIVVNIGLIAYAGWQLRKATAAH